MKKIFLFFIIIVFVISNYSFAGITGKISGKVTDAKTGEPLPGANITIEGTQLGAASNLNGQYFILNVPPGRYTLKASMVGYTKVTATDVRVLIDLTTTVDFSLSMEVLDMEEVIIVAERPLIEKDVSASQLNVVSKTIESLPVQDVDQVAITQAGIREGTDGIIIRGGSARQVTFMIDDFSLNDERSNIPYTNISLSSIKELQIQTGGFNAEYGNLRSGIVNVVTKEGDRNRYSATITYLYRPPNPKHFGPSLYGFDSYFVRPYVDPAVCWTGTNNGAWDAETQNTYPSFEGWIAVADNFTRNDDPITPEAAKRRWEWEHRRQGDIKKPDYNIDVGFGGPVPFVNKKLGDLRFFASHRSDREMFVFPLSRDSYQSNNSQLKLVSNINPQMKITLTSLYGEVHSVSPYNWKTTPTGWVLRTPLDVARQVNGTKDTGSAMLFVPGHFSPSSIYRGMFGVKYTHQISPNTFYEINLQHDRNRYNTYKMADRDTTKNNEVAPGLFLDEAPYGYEGKGGSGIGDGMRIGGWMNLGRDKSLLSTTKLSFNYTSQVNSRNELKTGLEITYNDYSIRSYTESPANNFWNREMEYDRFPYRIGAYIQDKLEYEGFIANIGFRMDYTNSNGQWYNVDPFDDIFKSGKGNLIEENATAKDAKGQLYLSPRLGISHPITDNSKLYFNYGHMYQEPESSYRYRLQREADGFVTYLGNANLELEKTVAYELGFSQNVIDIFLLNIAAYYKDITNQPNWFHYENTYGTVQYDNAESNNYEDIRGFEFTLTKSFGNWITGFLNYTYEVRTYGYFGFRANYQDRERMRYYLRDEKPQYQTKPLPQPYARANIDFHTPVAFGQQWFGWYPFESWNLNILAEWRTGRYETYNPEQNPWVSNNVQWKDYHNVDIRMGKNIKIRGFELQLFMDITNVFNVKYMAAGLMDYKNYAGFGDNIDYENYLQSLHFSWEEGDEHGKDKLGDYDKDYINLPNLRSLAFLNPRDFKFGIKLMF